MYTQESLGHLRNFTERWNSCIWHSCILGGEVHGEYMLKIHQFFFCTRINNFWFRFSHNSCGTLMHITHTYANTKYTHSSHVSLSLSSCYPKKVVRGCHKCWFNDIQLDSQGSSLTFTAWPCLFFFFFSLFRSPVSEQEENRLDVTRRTV